MGKINLVQRAHVGKIAFYPQLTVYQRNKLVYRKRLFNSLRNLGGGNAMSLFFTNQNKYLPL